MSDIAALFSRSLQSMALMLEGLDDQLDIKLRILRTLAREKQQQLEDIQAALKDVEDVYDELEPSVESSIPAAKRLFEQLLPAGSELLVPFEKESIAISEVLALFEPVSRQFSVLSDAESTGTPQDDTLENIRIRMTKRIRELLQTLIYLGDDNGTSLKLINSLNRDSSWSDLDKLANKTVDLLQARLNDEKVSFENYLSELSTKLNRIHDIVEADSKSLEQLKEINLAFNDSMQQQMADARNEIDQSSKVDTLKTHLLESLDSIADRIQSYQDSYTSQLHKLQSSREHMAEQVHLLEKENLNLLAELQQERKMSLLDSLTQLPNRQGFNRRMQEELARADRYSYFICIAILDIDFFKRINDQFGHLVGDKVLKMVAKEMKKVSRESDFLARYGGEEFILILPQTSLSDAVIALENVRNHIENCPFNFQSKRVPLTVSAGVAERQADESLEYWIDRADKALYDSKKTGRNRVTASSETSKLMADNVS